MELFWLFVAAVVVVFVIYRVAHKSRASQETSTGNTPYRGSIQGNGGLELKYEVSAREKTPSEERASALLKEATRLKDEKDTDGAILSLREAYDLIDQSPTIYPVKTFLRLPLYLQQAGRYTKARSEFAKLLDNGSTRIASEFSHISEREQKGLLAMDRSVIFDKMRLAAQREKEYSSAVYYQLLSEANAAVGLKLQDRDESDSYEDREFWLNKIQKLLKKSRKEDLSDKLTSACIDFGGARTNHALEKLKGRLTGILGISTIAEATQADRTTEQPMSSNNAVKSICAKDVNEILFNFTQRCFIDEEDLGKVDLSHENSLFQRLEIGSLNQSEAYQLPVGQRRLVNTPPAKAGGFRLRL